MQLSVKYGFAFLCMRKCASTSIEAAIKVYSDHTIDGEFKHINAAHYHKYIEALYNDFLPGKKIEKFCLMRDPLEWINSWYRYRSRPALANPQHPKHLNYTGNITFPDFVEAWLSDSPPSFACIGKQSEFVMLENGTIGVDRIFPMTRMDGVADFLTEKIGQKVEIPKKNVSPIGQGPQSLPADLALRAKAFLADDYKLYESIF